ncbi:MAG: adenine-specific methyltransferase EcoRI family protein [Chitinispirillales bacterium]|jgi:hypothetical protein|nr:adenine-specific methyltransferase EcoRI family protein [Chitinispirillales bacterium]
MDVSAKKAQIDSARKNKDDEFYTYFEDISAEVPLYKEQLRGKRILCPCDWDESYNEEIVFKEENHIIKTTLFNENGTVKNINIEQTKKKIEKDLNYIKCNFVKFLVSHAEIYGIKSISVSGYNPTTNKGIRFQDVDYSHYDLVITNPPFSQFREFIDVMFKNQMEFLIIGPLSAISYINIFPFIKNNQLWHGYHNVKNFLKPNGTTMQMGNVLWYTNLDVSYRHDKMILTEEYYPNKYQKFDNYDAINIERTKEIPHNYNDLMGVPITFLQKYNPEQFEIVDGIGRYSMLTGVTTATKGYYLTTVNGKRKFAKIIIKRK